MLPRQQSKPQYQTWGKTYGTTTNPKKTQRAATTKPTPWGRKTTHTPKANRNPMPQRVIHPTNKTPASSSLANFKVQQASRIKRSIFATLVVIQRATTDTKFSKGTGHHKADGTATIPRPLHLTQILITLCRGGTRRCRLAKPTHTKSEPKSNATTGNSSYKQDTRQLVACELQNSTSKPDREVHFLLSS